MRNRNQVIVSGAFDDLRLEDMLFLYTSSRINLVTALLWTDELCERITGNPPRFPFEERRYFLQSVRYVDRIHPVDSLGDAGQLPATVGEGATWVVPKDGIHPEQDAFFSQQGIRLKVIEVNKQSIPVLPQSPLVPESENKKVMVTGSFDWLHSGHIRFFEMCANFGDLFVIVGHDDNIRLLKGEGHPMFPQAERLFMVQSIRYVKRALISSGHGWMDAAPEVDRIRPDIYVVNEDGDVEEKRNFCKEKGIEYRILKRLPKPGLPVRRSTNLRRGLVDSLPE